MFLFQEAAIESCGSAPVLSESSPAIVNRTMSSQSWTPEAGKFRSLRLSQRCGQTLKVEDASEPIIPCAVSALPLLTDEVMGFGDVEVLLARRDSMVRRNMGGGGAEDGALEGAPGGGSRRSASASAWEFGVVLQAAMVPWLFRALVEGFQGGPLLGLVGQGLSGDEALHGLAEAWPHASAFVRTLVDAPAASLHVEEASQGCMRVALGVPLDLQAMAADYPSVAKILCIVRSVRLRFLDRPPSPTAGGPSEAAVASSQPPTVGEGASSGSCHTARRCGLLTMENGEIFLHFLLYGRHVAWSDEDGKPVLQDGKVAVLEEPISTSETPQPKELLLYLQVDNLRLRLSEFGCIGLSSLALPEMTLRFDIMTSPLGDPKGGLQGSEFTAEDPGRGNLSVHLVFRIVNMGVFPAEFLVRPLFDVKLMRSLLVRTFELSWSLRPSGNRSDWQVLQAVRVSFPKVARAFRICFRAFAQKQVKECDWFRLGANLFSAIAHDLRGLEDEARNIAPSIGNSPTGVGDAHVAGDATAAG